MTSTPDGPVVAWGESSTTYIARYAGGASLPPSRSRSTPRPLDR
jgi:hypothetical protein